MAFTILLAAASVPLAAQNWDTSGNGQLNGNYFFREVVWQYGGTGLQLGGSVYGTISFDGKGNYTLAGAQAYDSVKMGPRPYTLAQPGTFSIAASGYGFMDSPAIGDVLNVLVSNGIVVGSSTDNAAGYNDLFFAVPVAQSAPTLQGAYSVVGLDSPSLSVQHTRAYSFPLTAGAGGTIGTVMATGYFASTPANNVAADTLSGVTYKMNSGVATVQFGPELSSSNPDAHLLSGTKNFYLSPDGNFFFGGSPTGWDMIAGVRQNSGAAGTLSGLYYIAGMTQNDPSSASGSVNLNSGYGSLNALSSGLILAHQRVLSVSAKNSGPYDFTYSDQASNSGGSYGDSFTQYSVGQGGAIALGFARQPGLGMEVLVKAPALSGPGAYIYPNGVVNAGSLAPFTASWAPGELISIFGTNLAAVTATDASLPATLGGVQVLVNGSPAPVYFVSPGQINAVIPVNVSPSSTSAVSTASIQVVNNGTKSNTVWNYVGLTAPGVFNSYTAAPAIQHADYSMVTSTRPAKPGETILVYLTGVGPVDSSGKATQTFTASIGGVDAGVAYAGTQSKLGGGYQLNVTVPASGLTGGNAYLDISGPDSYNSEAVIPVAGSAAGASQTDMLSARSPRMNVERRARRLRP